MSPLPAMVEIPGRFTGPSNSGNGGYTCGVLADAMGQRMGDAVEVTLKMPPPLDTPLHVEHEVGLWRLMDGGRDVATSRTVNDDLDIGSIPRVTSDDAASGPAGFPFAEHHPFPQCYCCGTGRDDGLSIHCGHVPMADGSGIWASPWTATESAVTSTDGAVDNRFVWTALDCPSAAPFCKPDGDPVVLGRLAMVQHEPVPLGEQLVVLSWPLHEEGRKHTGASVIVRPGATAPLAEARATWITVPAGSIV